MSADNGIYILKTPARPIMTQIGRYENQSGFEYRVAHAQAIDNIKYSDLYIPLLFADSKVFHNHDDAMKEAESLLSEMTRLMGMRPEYGICDVSHHCKFPNMTKSEAARALDSYVYSDDPFFHPFEERTIEVSQVDTDLYLKFPSGEGITLQWRIENGSLDVILPEEGLIVTNWAGHDMDPAKPHQSFPDGHVRYCGQLVIELGEKFLETE